MRYVKAAAFAVVAAGSAFIAYGPLQNLWSDYQDSPTSTYLLYGLPPLVLSIASLVAAIRALRKSLVRNG
jgi:hypothetical protein